MCFNVKEHNVFKVNSIKQISKQVNFFCFCSTFLWKLYFTRGECDVMLFFVLCEKFEFEVRSQKPLRDYWLKGYLDNKAYRSCYKIKDFCIFYWIPQLWINGIIKNHEIYVPDFRQNNREVISFLNKKNF